MRDKRIPLKVLGPSVEGKKDELDYKLLLIFLLENSPAGGLTIGQIKERLGLSGRLKTATDSFDVSFREFQGIVGLVEKEKWVVISPNIVAFADDVRNAPDLVGPDPDVLDFPKNAVASA